MTHARLAAIIPFAHGRDRRAASHTATAKRARKAPIARRKSTGRSIRSLRGTPRAIYDAGCAGHERIQLECQREELLSRQVGKPGWYGIG